MTSGYSLFAYDIFLFSAYVCKLFNTFYSNGFGDVECPKATLTDKTKRLEIEWRTYILKKGQLEITGKWNLQVICPFKCF